MSLVASTDPTVVGEVMTNVPPMPCGPTFYRLMDGRDVVIVDHPDGVTIYLMDEDSIMAVIADVNWE